MEDEAIKVDVGKIEGEEVAKEVVIAPEEEVKHVKEENIGKEGWKPKTSLGIKVMPAPRGTGLCIERECQKILKLAGIKDVWSKTLGQTRTKLNMINACFEALKKLIEIKAQRGYKETTGVVEGRLETAAKE